MTFMLDLCPIKRSGRVYFRLFWLAYLICSYISYSSILKQDADVLQWTNMIFNQLLLNDKSNIPLFETDPDTQFYNELSIICNENSNYYSEDHFNQLLSRIECSQNLSFLRADIRSLKANRVMFESFIDYLQRKFSIIGLTETWLTPVNADLHTLPGFCHVYRCRQGRQGGGVSLFISNNLPFIVRQDLAVLTDQVE